MSRSTQIMQESALFLDTFTQLAKNHEGCVSPLHLNSLRLKSMQTALTKWNGKHVDIEVEAQWPAPKGARLL